MTNEELGLMFCQRPLVIIYLTPKPIILTNICTRKPILKNLVSPYGSERTVFIIDMLRLKSELTSCFRKRFWRTYDTMMPFRICWHRTQSVCWFCFDRSFTCRRQKLASYLFFFRHYFRYFLKILSHSVSSNRRFENNWEPCEAVAVNNFFSQADI